MKQELIIPKERKQGTYECRCQNYIGVHKRNNSYFGLWTCNECGETVSINEQEEVCPYDGQNGTFHVHADKPFFLVYLAESKYEHILCKSRESAQDAIDKLKEFLFLLIVYENNKERMMQDMGDWMAEAEYNVIRKVLGGDDE